MLGVHNYPPEIQEAYFKTHPRIETAPLSKRTILIKPAGIVMFASALTAGALLASAASAGLLGPFLADLRYRNGRGAV